MLCWAEQKQTTKKKRCLCFRPFVSLPDNQFSLLPQYLVSFCVLGIKELMTQQYFHLPPAQCLFEMRTDCPIRNTKNIKNELLV